MKRFIFTVIFLMFAATVFAGPPSPPSMWLSSGSDAITPVGDKSITIGSNDSFCVDTDGDGDIDICIVSTVPASATASGEAGDTVFDGNYMYHCIATDTWIRFTGASW